MGCHRDRQRFASVALIFAGFGPSLAITVVYGSSRLMFAGDKTHYSAVTIVLY